jgi:NRE family putative nickel resistance protein-like MFS transporter
MSFLASVTAPFTSLKNQVFAKIYFAQTISLLGDAFTWVGIALISYQFGQQHSAKVLSLALTMRVTAFILFSPFAGVLADLVDRKKVLYLTHFARMCIVACMPFVQAEWQIYLLVFLLNVFNAFFTPTYRSVIAQVLKTGHYREGIALSNATDQLLSVLGPGMAGILAVWLGARDIFFVDAATFIVAGILIVLLPATALAQLPAEDNEQKTSAAEIWKDVIKGTTLLFQPVTIRFSLLIEFVSAIAGAMILVNTVGHIKDGLGLADNYYGWVMSAFGIGATVAAFLSASIDKTTSKRKSLTIGIFILAAAVTCANLAPFPVLLVLWLLAGLGQSLAEMPSEILIGEQIPSEQQGKVYGAHFAWSHLWWAIAYPVAGFLGTKSPDHDFMIGGLIALLLAAIVTLFFRPNKQVFINKI